MGGIIWGVIAYVGLQFAIGIWVSRRIKTNADFILAGRSLGPGLLAFSVFATFFGAEAIVGTGGNVYSKGLAGSQTDPFTYGIAILLVGALLAKRLWKSGIVTFADFFANRYAPWVGKLVVIVLLPGSIFWAGAQIRAFGNIVSAATGLDVQVAITIAVIVVVAYSVLGGLLADAWTDFVQGIAVLLGLLVLLIVLINELGGVSQAISGVAAERLDPFVVGEGGLLALLERIAVPLCGTVVAIEIISRFLGARSAEVAVRGTLIGAVLYIIAGFMPVTIGLVAPSLLPNLDNPEQIIPVLAEKLLPSILYVMFAGAIISAILSTVDTVLLASAAQVAHNIVSAARPNQPTSAQLLTTRLTVVALAIVAYALAFTSGSVKQLVETASAAGSSGVFIVAMMGLFTSLGGPAAAATTIVMGLVSWSVCHWGLGIETPYLASLALSAATYGLFVAASFSRR